MGEGPTLSLSTTMAEDPATSFSTTMAEGPGALHPPPPSVPYASINVSPHPPLPGEVRQSWGFDLIRIQLPHPLGNIRIQILTGHALRMFRMRTLAIQYPDPWGKPAIPNKENSPPCPRWGGVGANIDRRTSPRSGLRHIIIRSQAPPSFHAIIMTYEL